MAAKTSNVSTRMRVKNVHSGRTVVADSRAPRDGCRFIEILGNYDSTKEPAIINIDEEKTVDWMLKGAQPTDTAIYLAKKVS